MLKGEELYTDALAYIHACVCIHRLSLERYTRGGQRCLGGGDLGGLGSGMGWQLLTKELFIPFNLKVLTYKK